MGSIGNDYFTNGVGLVAVPVPKNTAPSQDPAVDVIIISAPWLVRAERWAICALADYGLSLGNAKVYAFEPISEIAETFAWERLLEQGNVLVNILDDRHKGESLRPVVLMAHSLGGFILKRFLAIIHTTSRDAYKALRDAVAGVVFLGCPHASMQDRRDVLYKRSVAMLELNSPLSRKQRLLLEQGNILLSACAEVDRIGDRVDILTIHEQRPTKTGRKFSRSTSELVVDKQLATIKCHRWERVTYLPYFKDPNSKSKLDDFAVTWIQEQIRKNPVPSRSGSGRGTGARTPLPEAAQPVCEEDDGSLLVFLPKVPDTPPRAPRRAPENPGLDPLIAIFKASSAMPTTLPHLSLDIARERNPLFCGRHQDLIELDEHLTSGTKLVVLRGRGGIGKTELAIEYVHRNSDKFDVVFWLQADDLSKLRQDFGRISAELGLDDGSNKTDPFTSREMVKTWLIESVKPATSEKAVISQAKAQWLIIFDNVNERGVLSEFAGLPGLGSILVTSRDSTAASAFASDSEGRTPSHDAHQMDLEPFSGDVATTMLKDLAGVTGKEEHRVAQQLAGQLDGLPLAINEMGRIIGYQQLNLAEFREQYMEPITEDGPSMSPVVAVDVSLSSIRMTFLSCAAKALLRVCAMLDPDCIHETLFSSLTQREIVLEKFPISPMEFSRARTELLNSSLVQRNKTKQQLWMHRITQDAVRNDCEEKLLDRVFRTTAAIVKKAWQRPPDYVRDNLKIWEPCAAYLRHVIHLQGVYQVKLKGISKPFQPSYPFAWLLNEVGCFQRNLGHTAGLKKTLDLALSVCISLKDSESVELLCDIYHGLGAWANETNKPHECMDYNMRYLRLRTDLLKTGVKPNERTAAAYNQYGTGLMMDRRYIDAVCAFEKSIEIYGKYSTRSPCANSLAVVNLALAKAMLNDLEGSVRLLEEGRLAREEAFGFMDSDSFRTGRFFHALGNVKYDQRDIGASKIWHTRALAQYTKSLGPRHHRTADVRHRVAMHCLSDGDHARAGVLIEQALESWRMDADAFLPEIARTTWLKAQQQDLAGTKQEAGRTRVQAAEMRMLLRPGDRRDQDLLTDADFDDLVSFWSR